MLDHNTTSIKGVAICIMLFHHFFGFPNWIEEGIVFYGIPFRGTTIEYYLAVFGKVCVAMYTVLSGYGLFISYEHKEKLWDFPYLLRKTIGLLLNWWLIVLIVEVPIIFIQNLGGGVDRIIGHLTLTNLEGNPFVGYLKFYLLALWTSPLCYMIVKRWKWNNLFLFILPFAGMTVRKIMFKAYGSTDIIETYALYIPYFLTGMMIYKAGFYEKSFRSVKKFKWGKGIAFFLIIGCVVMRTLAGAHALSFDSWFALILIFAIALCFQEFIGIRRGFAWLGQYSTGLWYSHAIWIFGGIVMQKILYAPRIPILIIVWGIALCMPGVVIVEWLMKRCNALRSKKKLE